MKKIAITIAALLFAAPVLAQSAAQKSGAGSPAPKTEDFVNKAATSDMFEIQSSQLALERADDATKSFAQQMITDHQKTTSQLKQLVTSGKVKARLPTAMSSSQQKMLTKLKGLQGSDFTKQYHLEQVSAHKEAVDLFKRYGSNGKNADLKTWAASTEPALEHHLQMAEDLNK